MVLYWYQMPSHVVASEWSAKFWLMADALRYKRTDTALVRIVFDGEEESPAASEFLEAVQPPLRRVLPQEPGALQRRSHSERAMPACFNTRGRSPVPISP